MLETCLEHNWSMLNQTSKVEGVYTLYNAAFEKQATHKDDIQVLRNTRHRA